MNLYFGKARQSEFLREAEHNRLVKQAKLSRPRRPDRFLMGIVNLLGFCGLMLQHHYKRVKLAIYRALAG